MSRPLADVVLAEEVDESVEIVRVERGTHPFDQLGNHPSSSLPNASTLRGVLRLACTVAVLAVASALLKTPYPPQTAGTGKEPTSGSGQGAGMTFRPRSAIATYEPISGAYVLYLTPKPVACNSGYLAAVPYLTVSIVTAGSPLVVGAPSPQRGDKNFVQVAFYVARTHYYSVQPGVRLVLTRVDARKNKLWHGKLSVPKTTISGKTFAFKGTFAARWCGRV